MKPFSEFIRRLFRRPLEPLVFSGTNIVLLDDCHFAEEDAEPQFKAGNFYPVNIGDVYHNKYQVLGKLGYGTTATVWFARNLLDHSHCVLKIYSAHVGTNKLEFEFYQVIGQANPKHVGYQFVRRAIEVIELERVGDNGETIRHDCLVQTPMWDSWKGILQRNPSGRFNVTVLKGALGQLFRALDYLHTECHAVHADISPQNIMTTIEDKSVFSTYTNRELASPTPRKVVDGKTVYASRGFERPKHLGHSLLSDFGRTVFASEGYINLDQPQVYQAPEIILKAGWSYPIDIWNAGCMIWDLYLRRHLFNGSSTRGGRYTTGGHLAEMVALLGPPPLDFIQRGRLSGYFFNSDGQWRDDIGIPIPDISWETVIERVDEEEKAGFLALIRGIFAWRPEDRKTAKELYKDPWIRDYC